MEESTRHADVCRSTATYTGPKPKTKSFGIHVSHRHEAVALFWTQYRERNSILPDMESCLGFGATEFVCYFLGHLFVAESGFCPSF